MKLWTTSETAKLYKSGPQQGKNTDPTAGVSIFLFPENDTTLPRLGTRGRTDRLLGQVAEMVHNIPKNQFSEIRNMRTKGLGFGIFSISIGIPTCKRKRFEIF